MRTLSKSRLKGRISLQKKQTRVDLYISIASLFQFSSWRLGEMPFSPCNHRWHSSYITTCVVIHLFLLWLSVRNKDLATRRECDYESLCCSLLLLTAALDCRPTRSLKWNPLFFVLLQKPNAEWNSFERYAIHLTKLAALNYTAWSLLLA